MEHDIKELNEKKPKKDRKQTEGVVLSPGNNKTMAASTATTNTKLFPANKGVTFRWLK